MLLSQLRALAKLRHVGAQVVNPGLLGIAFVAITTGEKQHVGFNALSVKNAGRQTQDGVQIAFIHQVAANIGADVGFEQHVIRQHHGSTATRLQAPVDMLQKAELFVVGGISKVIAAGQTAAFFGAKRWIGQDQ
jgi:hypothetical protein